MNSNIKERQSNFELLRILAMYMIVVHHFCVHGIFPSWDTNVTFLNHINNFIAQIFNLGGKIGVDIFVLITGFFMIDSKFKWKSFSKVFMTTFFYSALIVFFALIFGLDLSAKYIKHLLFPLDKGSYWFIAAYLVLYLFIPFINTLLNSISKKQFEYLIILCLILWSFLNVEFSNIGWFFAVYAIGGYIKKYAATPPHSRNAVISRVLTILYVGLLMFGVIFLLHFTKNPIHFHYYKMNDIFILLISISIFYIFKELKVPHNKLLNAISASVFSVYLIHDNNIIRPLLWNAIHANYFITVPYFIIAILFISLVIFIICIILDKILGFVYKPLIDFVNNLIIKLTDFIVLFKQKQQRNEHKA